jgi:protein-disulfide isomerase
MLKKILGVWMFLVFLSLFLCIYGFAQEDKIGQIAINIFRSQVRLPQRTEIRFLEKKESPIPDFYSVKILLSMPDKDMPVVIYVDKSGEKVMLGSLFIKGENVTTKEAGPPIPKKADMRSLDIEKSPSIGPTGAKVTIVEFSNFECPFCLDSWMKLKELLDKHPEDILYVFKHFPFQTQGRAFELSEMAAATQEVSNKAFWVIHDFLFSPEGQAFAGGEKEALKKRIEEVLKEKGYDTEAFQSAIDTGKGKKRVVEDMSVGNRLRVTGTPTKVINGDIIVGSSIDDNVWKRFLEE